MVNTTVDDVLDMNSVNGPEKLVPDDMAVSTEACTTPLQTADSPHQNDGPWSNVSACPVARFHIDQPANDWESGLHRTQ